MITKEDDKYIIRLSKEDAMKFFFRLKEWIETEHNAAEGVSDDDEAHYLIEQMIDDFRKL